MSSKKQAGRQRPAFLVRLLRALTRRTRADRLWQRIVSRVPYGAGSRTLAWFWKLRPIQKLFFQQQLKALEQILPLSEKPVDPRSTGARYLACSYGIYWRLFALSRCSDPEFHRWVRFSGMEQLQPLCEAGKGLIIISSHIGLSRSIPLLLLRQGYDLHSVEAANVLEKIGAKGADRLKVIEVGGGASFLLRQTYQARRVLMGGGILHMVPDGLKGSSGIEVPFHGRIRNLATGFAELAVSTGAAVVPVIANMDVNGRIHVAFSAPLDTGSEALERQERIEGLISQYASYLEARWSDDPGSVRMHHVEHYLGLPVATSQPLTDSADISNADESSIEPAKN
ncbi:KDO2-lipid IV(A) lauroyltransferase [Thiogranum longum]|uniref:KDO2-lipid IV(A) lauroyltransferase n=1 Tax=Thiogranum longum TaxID=1537524 RepID=A0A4R1HD18_9GAMM|nr:lipid A biosynthesis lauroyl acyltransferase [Thiogranum longum]TCK18175.1 KDO2-lipid IV(A) lauroyltransferase [Thiogranum longum]